MGIGEWVTGNGKNSRYQKAGLNCQFHRPPARSIINYQLSITSYQLPINCQQSVIGSSGLIRL
ncbi:hypothetical protein C7B69_21165 [filamentous cyanobacterium Phorm 46]|nr:hypothetical protein C7B69_21165 [filamentous cyanobacterium Phorm 46]PSB51620.1 hypothetical protein C7B67_10160 [filamentous cyanobacterium Phorm 6]